MNMSKWRLGFYCFCLVALGLASNAVNTIPSSPAERTLASRGIASEVAVAIDRMAEEEILIVTPNGILYKRTKYVESIRAYINDSAELKAKIKAKDAEIKRKAKQIANLKAEKGAIAIIAIQEIEKLRKEKTKLQSDMVAIKRMHATEIKGLKSNIDSLKLALSSEKSARAEDIQKRDERIKEELRLKEETLAALAEAKEEHSAEKATLEKDIATLKGQLASETSAKEAALLELETLQGEFANLQSELELTSGELDLAEDEILSLETQVAALSDDLKGKEEKIAEQETKIASQSTEIETQGAQLADLRIAECEQQKQLKELQEQLSVFQDDKKEMDEVIAALKKEKEATAAARKKEKQEIAALMEQFTMYAMLANQTPMPQMPVVTQNPLTDSSMIDWNAYMNLAMMNNMFSRPGSSPFDFNGGNSQVNSYYYMPKQGMDSFLYHSARNPQGTSWGDIGPRNYYGELGQGFDFRPSFDQYSSVGPSRNPAYFGF